MADLLYFEMVQGEKLSHSVSLNRGDRVRSVQDILCRVATSRARARDDLLEFEAAPTLDAYAAMLGAFEKVSSIQGKRSSRPKRSFRK